MALVVAIFVPVCSKSCPDLFDQERSEFVQVFGNSGASLAVAVPQLLAAFYTGHERSACREHPWVGADVLCGALHLARQSS